MTEKNDAPPALSRRAVLGAGLGATAAGLAAPRPALAQALAHPAADAGGGLPPAARPISPPASSRPACPRRWASRW
ncbi:hypothetical protein [Teichococcus aestuarii]|uniref:hypothetical protein n=1 Tax=Teichococcus aestuarii TaxID=568898 RepID=UPI003613490D